MPSVPRGVLDAVVHHNTAGGNEIVPAVAGKSYRVISALLMAAGAVTVTFTSSGNGTAPGDELTGDLQVGANGGFCLPYNPLGWFQTEVGEALILELSGAVFVDGVVNYIEV